MTDGSVTQGAITKLSDPSPRERIIDALMNQLAFQPIERIEIADVAKSAGVSLAELRDHFSSLTAIVGASMKDIDRKVLEADLSDMDDEPVREKLFDILMRRLEALTPYKAAMRSLVRSAFRNPPLALALNTFTARSMSWMLTAAGISTAGPQGVLRAQGLALAYARVLSIWVDDDDPGLARTMAALDRELARGQQLSGFVDRLFGVASRLQSGGRWRARRHRDVPPDGDVAA